MMFESAEAFALILLLVPMLAVFRRSEQRTRKTAAIYKGTAPGRRVFVLRAASFSVFLCALSAVGAGPYITYDVGADVIFLIDVSRSMSARHSCAEPTFLDRAKYVMRNVIHDVPEARYSIFAFDRFAFPLTQLTDDQGYLEEVIEHSLYVGLMLEATQTDIGNALSAVAAKKQRLPEIYGQASNVILLSDGYIEGDYRRRLRQPIEQVKNADLAISTVGIGNPERTPLTEINGERCSNEHVEVDGRKITIPLRTDVLTYIAAETGGRYFSEAETTRLVQLIKAELRESAVSENELQTVRRRDMSSFFLGLATVALFGFVLVSSGLGGMKR